MTYARIGALFIGLLAYLGLFRYYIIWKGPARLKDDVPVLVSADG